MENKENHYEGYDEKFETENNSSILYERSRIKALAEQREEVQKKTFTKWINAHLVKCRDIEPVKDLFTDLQDGKVLLKLLEIISGEKLPGATKGKMRIHCIENIGKSLQFLNNQHVYLENLGPHDIVDGNQTLILGLIWTLILRFQIQPATQDVVDSSHTSKEALLLWSQMKTAGYPNVNIRNFTTSWKDGLALNAILHKHNPEVVDIVNMTKATPLENLNIAFKIAEEEYGVPPILDANDLMVDQPDEKSVMTYVGLLSNTLNKLKDVNVKNKRLCNVINEAITIEDLIKNYETGCSNLLDWIRDRIDFMDNEPMGQSLQEVKDQLTQFTDYRLTDKPPKFDERSVLEMSFFEIQSKLRNDNRKIYIAPEGKLISDINRAWEDLEKAEHRMEIKLYDELVRQEKMDQVCKRFIRKAQMRETWLSENDRLVHQDIFGDNLVTVDAAIKKHEALECDIYAHEDRIMTLGSIADELDVERYYKVEDVKARYAVIKALWDQLLEDIGRRRDRLDKFRDIQLVLQESDHVLDCIQELGGRLKTKDCGKHLLGVEYLLEGQKILSSDIRNLDNKIADITEKLGNCDLDNGCIEPSKIKDREEMLRKSYGDLLELTKERESELGNYKTVWQLIEELDNDKEWIKEINQLMLSPDVGHDLPSVERLIRKHEQVCSDADIRHENVDHNVSAASLISNKDMNHDRKVLLSDRIDEVEHCLDNLAMLTKERRDKLEDSVQFYQLMTDVDDTDTMIVEQRRMFDSTDVGDKQTMTEFYMNQYNEQMVQVNQLGDAVTDQLQRGDQLKESALDSQQTKELDQLLEKMEHDFADLRMLTKQRKGLLDNSLTKFKLFNDIDGIETWIVAKEKFLNTLLTSTEEIDELNVIKHRFDCFIDQMRLNSEKLSQINDVSSSLVDQSHPEAEIIKTNQSNVNKDWNELADITAGKQKELEQSLAYNQFLIECQETCSWIGDKMSLLEWTDDLSDDLDGTMQLQRRLGSLQRDVQAVEAKVHYLNGQAIDLTAVKPSAEHSIGTEMDKVNELWTVLKKMLQDRDSRLNSSNELQKFLQDLDLFNVWLSTKQREVACQDIPNGVQEAEKLFTQHQEIKKEINCWIPEFNRLLEFGRTLSQSKDDPQYLLFNQRLNSLEDGWEMLNEMCLEKDVTLQQSIDAQTFNRDALQVDRLLTKQETFLAKEDSPTSLEASENNIREFETFKTSVISNQPKIDSVLSFGDSMISTNALSDKIAHKCDQIRERCAAIQLKMEKRDNTLKDEFSLKTYCEDVMDLEEWIAEKMLIATDTSYRDAKDISTRYNRFKDFGRELEASKDKVDDVIKTGEELISKCPQLEDEIAPKIVSIDSQWCELMKTVQDKCNAMEDANREEIFDESAKSIMSWVTEISSQIITTDETTSEFGLVEITEKMEAQKAMDQELEQKRKMLEDIDNHTSKLKEQYPDRQEEFEQIQMEVRVKLSEMEAPLADRRQKLTQHRTVQQFLRDLQDEKEWIEDKMRFIKDNKVSPESLQVCLQKIRRLKTLATEIDNHESRIDDIKQTGQNMIDEGHPSSDKFKTELRELGDMWSKLKEFLHECQDFFDTNRKVHEYLSDAGESESWMSEREFDLMREEKTKDEEGALNAMRKHEQLTSTIHNYATDICGLGDRSRDICAEELPGWHAVAQRQEKVDKTYAGLLEMCLDRRMRIEDLVKLHHLLRSIQDLEEWIAERTVVASSPEVGSEFEHCNLLRDRFAEFAIETNELGGHRVAEAMDMCDRLIEQGHQDAAEIAGWKDRVNEAWADLLELIETRIQLLKAAWDFFKFMNESADLIDRIHEKVLMIPVGMGKDAKTVASYQRKHAAFMLEVNSLKSHVDSAIDTATHLLPYYAGDKEQELIERRAQLQRLWHALVMESEKRNGDLMDGTDFFRFSSMIRELMNWMNDIEKKVNNSERARDVCGVELIISNHKSLKAEIDSRDENKSICLTLGRSLIEKKNPKSDEIRQKCTEVVAKHFKINEDWLAREEYLDMILEVYQFSRDAAVAESWLMAQEPNVHTKEIGESLADTLNLIQKHQGLERTLSTQEDRFEALKKLTVFEEKTQAMTKEEKLRDEEKKRQRLQDLLYEFRTPVVTPKEVSRKSSIVDSNVEEMVVPQLMRTLAQEPTPMDSFRQSAPAYVETKELSSPTPEPLKGNVVRKHEWESPTKKAKDRAWHNLFMSYQDGSLSFYKDERHFQDDKTTTYKHEPPMDLDGAKAFVANSYKKRINVLRLTLKAGSEYLVQTMDEGQMTKWVDLINRIGGVDVTKAASATLPNQSTDFGQEVGTKKKVQTLTRKQK